MSRAKTLALHLSSSGYLLLSAQSDSDGDSSAEAAAEAATAALDDLRELVRDAERERGIDLLESFEHFDRRGQVEWWPPTCCRCPVPFAHREVGIICCIERGFTIKAYGVVHSSRLTDAQPFNY